MRRRRVQTKKCSDPPVEDLPLLKTYTTDRGSLYGIEYSERITLCVTFVTVRLRT